MKIITTNILNKFLKAFFIFFLTFSMVSADEVQKTKEKITPIYVEEGLAIGGYDPVAYFKDKKPVRGNKKYAYTWQGETWQFANAANLADFKKDPLAYYPQYGGHCAYAVAGNYLVKGDGRAWTVLDGKLYLNYNLSVRSRWLRDTTGYLKKSEKNWKGLK